MIRPFTALAALSLCACAVSPSTAAPRPDFEPGPVIEAYGANAAVDADFTVPDGMELKVAFDTNTPAEPGEISRTLNTPARFINMNARAGVPVDKLHAAVVVHGKAAFDLMTNDAYVARNPDAAGNANAGLVAELLAHNARIILCGQTAAAYEIKTEELVPGVEIAVSAITAHAVLQRQGYSSNPF